MKSRMLLAAATAAALLAGSSSAATLQLCEGEACSHVSPLLLQGCWNFYNKGDKRVRGIIFAGGEWLLFEIEAGWKTGPRYKNGVCLRDAVGYHVDFKTSRTDERGRPRR